MSLNRYIQENLFGSERPIGTAQENYEGFVKAWGVDGKIFDDNDNEITVEDIQEYLDDQMKSFKSLVAAVEENNSINDAEWSTWENAKHIESIYGQLEPTYADVAREFLNALIRDNGENRVMYLETMDCLVYGYPFERK